MSVNIISQFQSSIFGQRTLQRDLSAIAELLVTTDYQQQSGHLTLFRTSRTN